MNLDLELKSETNNNLCEIYQNLNKKSDEFLEVIDKTIQKLWTFDFELLTCKKSNFKPRL